MVLLSLFPLAILAQAGESPIKSGLYMGQVHGDKLSWGDQHPHAVRSKLNYREEAAYTTTCSHVHCTHNAETGKITVHHASHEQHGDTHWCLHHMHKADKCGCECYDKNAGLIEHIKQFTKGLAPDEHHAHQNFTGVYRFISEGTCEKAGFETVLDSNECATADILLLKMGKQARDSLDPKFDAYKDADAQFSHVPRGCVFHRQMPGQMWDTVQIYPSGNLDCGAHNYACICKLPESHYGAAVTAKRTNEAHKAAQYHRMRDLWKQMHKTASPTRTPTPSPTATPTKYTKCGCGTKWDVSALGSFCILCSPGTYQPEPHSGTISACLPCPAGHSSTSGACGCTTNQV